MKGVKLVTDRAGKSREGKGVVRREGSSVEFGQYFHSHSSMAFPFPGMNHYLEHPDFWPEVHHLLIGILAETLNPQLLPHYRAAIEKRVYQSDG